MDVPYVIAPRRDGDLPAVYSCPDKAKKLLGWQTEGVVAHGVENVEALLAFEACIDVAGYVAERVTYVQTCAAGVGEHVEDIEFLTTFVLADFVCLAFRPEAVPLLFYFSEVIFFCHWFDIVKER